MHFTAYKTIHIKNILVFSSNFKVHISKFMMYMTFRAMQQCKTSAIVQLNMLLEK